MELRPGMLVEVRRLRCGFDGRVFAPFEVWVPATFLGYQHGHPAVRFKDGSAEVLHSSRDVR